MKRNKLVKRVWWWVEVKESYVNLKTGEDCNTYVVRAFSSQEAIRYCVGELKQAVVKIRIATDSEVIDAQCVI